MFFGIIFEMWNFIKKMLELFEKLKKIAILIVVSKTYQIKININFTQVKIMKK